VLDLALPVRLANLAPGAKLDIFRVNASEGVSLYLYYLILVAKPITLALQCSDPVLRLTGTFPPTATLTEVLLHFEQESNARLVVFGRKGVEAVLSVLGREFSITEGSGGGTTTLAGMGVGGNVLIRLDFRKTGSSSVGTSSSGTSVSTGSVSPVPAQFIPQVSSSSSSRSPPNTPLSPSNSSPSSVPSITQRNESSSLGVSSPSNSLSADASPPVESSSMEVDVPASPIGPQNRSRIVYAAANDSTPTAAKCTTLVSKLI
jgi:hypothetical protein